ncbi:MAG TPA: SRPBCC family protein [Chitinophagaceae bacterium]|nr:SRPBCC family protein [Chitinophagaceae bacterium]
MILTILLVLIAFIALLLIVALFVKKEYAVQRQVIINKPKTVVFDFIKYLKNQDRYSYWATIDPAMQKTYNGIDGTTGFTYAWDSTNKKAGKGEQQITELIPNDRVAYAIHFIRPFDGHALASMSTEGIAQTQTQVNWHFTGTMKYPMNLMLLFMNLEKLSGNDLEIGLHNLKMLLEKE